MDAIYSLMSALKGQQRQMDAVANNLANAETPGYKKDTVVFREMYNEYTQQDLESDEEGFAHEQFLAPLGRGHSSYVMPDHVSPRMTTGRITPTNNPFDMALQTDGFFVVEGDRGEAFTRNGRFMRDNEGYLVNTDGAKVMGKEGPILAKGEHFSVGRDGTVLVDNQKVGVLKVVRFEQPHRLTKLGANLFVPGSAAQIAIDQKEPLIQQGVYEGSNVDTVQELTEMIGLNRHYEAAQKALRSSDSLTEQAITIARI